MGEGNWLKAGKKLRAVERFFDWAIGPILEELAKLRQSVDSNNALMQQRMDNMAIEFDRLTSEVSEMESVVDGAIKVINDLAAEIRATAGNESASKALADRLDAKAQALASAIAASTPAEPPAEPPAA